MFTYILFVGDVWPLGNANSDKENMSSMTKLRSILQCGVLLSFCFVLFVPR